MRRDDHALELFFRDIGKGKDRPVALVSGGGSAHFDAPTNAVGTGGRRDLEGIALVGVDLGGGGEVEGGIVAGDLHRLGGQRQR